MPSTTRRRSSRSSKRASTADDKAQQQPPKRSRRHTSSDQQKAKTTTKKAIVDKKDSVETTSSTTTTATTTSTTDQEPWYHFFTKGDEEYNTYMREEWGFEKRGDVALFEKLSLEGAQSGLSWLTILRKREAYRRTFHHFDPRRVAAITNRDVERILSSDTSSTRDVVVRHRGKIEAVINNAKCLLKMQKEAGEDENALDSFLWSFVQDQPILNRHSTLKDVASQTPESQAMSKALKKAGWKFVGPTTCYAMMQSMGMVIDHPMYSPEWQQALERLQKRAGGYQDAGNSRSGDKIE